MRFVDAEIAINIAPKQGVDAFTDPELLKGWWGVERSLVELKPGGIYALAWGITEHGFRFISSGVVKSYREADHLHVENLIYLNPERPILGPLELSVQCLPEKAGCLLKLRQGPYPADGGPDWDWYYAVVSDAWPKVLVELKKFLEEKFPT